MKKVKLLILGLLTIVGFSINQSFALIKSEQGLMIEAVTQYAGNLYESQLLNVNTQQIQGCSWASGRGFSLLKYFNGQSINVTDTKIYNGYYGYYNPYDWTTRHTPFNSYRNVNNGTQYGTGALKVLTSTNRFGFGTFMVSVQNGGTSPWTGDSTACNSNSSCSATPTFSIGSGWLSSPTISSFGSFYGGVRLFFEAIETQNGDYYNPINGMNFISQTGETQANYFYLQQFTPTSTSIVGHFGGDGARYIETKQIPDTTIISQFGGFKGKHFGLYGLGYTFASNSCSSNSVIDSQCFGFDTISSNISSVLNSSSSNYSDYMFSDIGLFRSSTYSTAGSDYIIAISRLSGQPNKLIYQTFSCSSDMVSDVLSDTSNCVSLGYGNLGIMSGDSLTDEILPFQNSDGTYNSYTIGNGNSVLDFFFDGGILGYTEIDSDGINFYSIYDSNGCPYPSSTQSLKLYFMPGNTIIKEQYNNQPLDIAGQVDYYYNLCTTNSVYYNNNYFLCNSLVGDFPNGTGVYTNQNVCYLDGSGNRVCSVVTTSYQPNDVWTGIDGQVFFIMSGDEIPLVLVQMLSGYNYLPGFVHSGIIDTSYFSDWPKRLFYCPFPIENPVFGFASKIRIGNYYPLKPLECFVSAFQEGMQVHYFDNFNLFTSTTGQILYGTSDYHKIMFQFFDILLSLGLVMMYLFIFKLSK